MIVKRGVVVSHKVAREWGIGKVTEVNEVRATIRFNDGSIRKITSSHFRNLQPADPAAYRPPEKVPAAKLPPARRKTRQLAQAKA